MEIIRTYREGVLELIVEGRLDLYWADHLNTAVQGVLREGAHAVRINLSKATYISSAGIGALVRLHQQFTAVNGSFAVVEPSTAVLNVLKLARVADLLTKISAPAVAAKPADTVERHESGGAVFEIHKLNSNASLACALAGDPGKLATTAFAADVCHNVQATPNRVALGLGGIGDGFEACRDRFGEFLAVSGCAACQPTDGTNFPDYMSGSDTFAPQIAALYGLCLDGDFGTLLRFESVTGNDPLPFSTIVSACLDFTGASTAGIVILAESAGLMGASLKRSPVESGRLFAFPEIRQWLNFSPEREHLHALALIAGVVAKSPAESLRPFVRAMNRDMQGHFHAAVFNYRPLQKGNVAMQKTVAELFEAGGLLAVMHLLNDDRFTSGGESELLRGACWVSPIRDVRTAEAAA